MCRKSHGGFGEKTTVGSAQAHLLIAQLPVGLVPKAQHLPHHNPEAPHVTGRGEDPIGNGFRCCPTDGDLSSLKGHIGQNGDVFRGMEDGHHEVTVSTGARVLYLLYSCACMHGMK